MNKAKITYKDGDRVECNGNKEAIIIRQYSAGMYEVRLYQGYRIVGDVCVSYNAIKSL